MVSIENGYLKINIREKGAELAGISGKHTGLEYLWNGDPAFWGKQSPVLFPIVGTLKNDSFLFQGTAYHLGRHGFARDRQFMLREQTGTTAILTLGDDAETLENYPFPFRFDIGYALNDGRLSVTYTVSNTGAEPMYFSVGGHPAFRIPLVAGTRYEDYFLVFEEAEEAGRWPISPEGLIESAPVPLMWYGNQLPLTRELFYNDALVFKQVRSTRVSIRSANTVHGLSLQFNGFPYLGVWAAKNADFVCIEPWCGIADPVNSNRQLTEKEGIIRLAPGGVFERTWRLDLF